METEKYEVMGITLDLKKGKALEIEAVFIPFYTGANELEAEYNEIVKTKEITPELAIKAGLLRKKHIPLRTGSDKARKEYKSDVLKLGKAIDSLGNIVKEITVDREAKLKEIENFAKIAEEERLDALKI